MAHQFDPFSKTILLNIPPGGLDANARASARHAAEGTPKVRQDPRTVAAAAIQNADLKVLFKNVYDAALIVDLSGNILDANPRASVAFDYSVDEFCERKIAHIIVGFDDAVMRTVCGNLQKDQFTLIQAYCRCKDGTSFPAEISTSHIRLSFRDYLCFFIRDVTTRKDAEEQLQRAYDELAAQVARRTQLNKELKAEIAVRTEMEGKLREAIVKLQEHDKAKSQFVSNVSHELKTPLASIHYISGNLLKGIAGEMSDKARTYLEMIRFDGQRLMRTVEDILDMSRLEANALKLRCVKIQFPRFVHKAVESLRMQVESAGLTFSVSIVGGGQFVNGDPQKLERVIFNIIRNAIKFNIPKGSVSVVMRPDPDAPGIVILEVVDTGIGIEPQHLARIAERFFRVGEHISGAGLGLSICKELLEHHGGTLQIQSPPPGGERGTLVTVRLPTAEPALVLLVCDEGRACDRLAGALTACGYKVASVPLGSGLDLALKETKPDLLILDWIADGLEAAGVISAVKRSDVYRQMPLIVLTGGEFSPVKQEIIEGFGLPVLKSPWTDDEVCARLDQVIVGRKDAVV